METLCNVPDCGPAKKITKGFCNKHYKRHWKGKPVEVDAVSKHPPLVDRYWKSVDKSAGEDSCWIWTACTRLSNTTYYGRIKLGRKVYSAHRVGYAIAHGIDPTELPTTVPVHHTCGNSLCQQPAHLQATTAAENTAEMLERTAYIRRIEYLEELLDQHNIAY